MLLCRGHLEAACPANGVWVLSQFMASGSASCSLTPIKVKHNTKVTEVNVLIDSGPDESLMDWELAKKLGLKTEALSQPQVS